MSAILIGDVYSFYTLLTEIQLEPIDAVICVSTAMMDNGENSPIMTKCLLG